MRDARKDESFMPPMPPCDAMFLFEYLMDMGPVESGGMGPAQLSEQAVEAWQFNTGIELSNWQTRTMRRLSAEYLGQYRDAEKRDCRPPWTPAPDIDRAAVAKRVRSFLRE